MNFVKILFYFLVGVIICNAYLRDNKEGFISDFFNSLPSSETIVVFKILQEPTYSILVNKKGINNDIIDLGVVKNTDIENPTINLNIGSETITINVSDIGGDTDILTFNDIYGNIYRLYPINIKESQVSGDTSTDNKINKEQIKNYIYSQFFQ